MDQADDFFVDLKEWSARKLRIIEKYIGGFSRILGSKFKNVYYVDGFAGRGKYDTGEKGSPVLAAEIALQIQLKDRPFRLNCINVERDSENFLDLTAETQRFGNLVRNYRGTFEDNIQEILSHTLNSPAIFFIDDFGVKGTGWEAVEETVGLKGAPSQLDALEEAGGV